MKKSFILLLLMTAGFGSGCGRNFTGTYVGTENISMTSMSLPAAQITLTMNQSSSESVSVNWGSSGTLMGRVVNGNTLQLVSGSLTTSLTGMTGMTMPGVSPYGAYPTTGYPTGVSPYGAYPTTGAMTPCPISGGTLTLSGRQLTGSIMFSSTAMTTGTYMMCPTSRTVTATLQ